MRVRRLFTSASLAVVALAAVAAPGRADFVYNNFSSTAGLQLNGTAAHVGNVLRLTPTTTFAGGSAFTTSTIPLGNQNSFSTYFSFLLTGSGGISDNDGTGADGLVFVVQTVSNNVGGAGAGIGYQGINPSLGIEFDTFNNSEVSGNHVGINTNGSTSSLVSVNEPTRFNNGQVWNAWVDYNGGTGLLEVRWSLSAIRPAAAGLSTNLNLATILGQNTAFVGFTAATGSAVNNHDLLSWEFRESFNPVGVAPEPISLSLFALGAGVFGLHLRRKK